MRTKDVNRDALDRVYDCAIVISDTLRSAADDESSVSIAGIELKLCKREINCFLASYANEDSFRGEYCSSLRDLVSLYMCFLITRDHYQRVENTEYLWQRPAQDLRRFAEIAKPRFSTAASLIAIARERGLYDHMLVLKSAASRLEAIISANSEILDRVLQRNVLEAIPASSTRLAASL